MGLSYKDSGVDIEAQDALVERIKSRTRDQRWPGVLSGVGGFASLFSLKDAAAQLASLADLTDPILVSGTDGVGTKLRVAAMMNVHDTIGIDLVAMCVNDILTTGATPLFFLDYFVVGELDVEIGDQVVAGIVEGCRRARIALVGGETAEHPGNHSPSEYDLAGFAVGVVERSRIIDGTGARAGDRLIGVPSTGVHSNGFSLARKALFERAGLTVDQRPEALGGKSVGEALLEPTRLYTDATLSLLDAVDLRALAHITGGGIVDNLPRVLPEGLGARIETSAWKRPPIFDLIQSAGEVAEPEMAHTFNLGLGLIAVVPAEDVSKALATLEAAGYPSSEIGQLEAGPSEVQLV